MLLSDVRDGLYLNVRAKIKEKDDAPAVVGPHAEYGD